MDIIKYFDFDRDEYSAREVTEIVAKELGYNIDGYTSNSGYVTLNNLLLRRLRVTASKFMECDSSMGIKKQYSRKTPKGEVFDVAVVKCTVNESLSHLLTNYFKGDAADRLLDAGQKAAKLNLERDWELYADGNVDCISDAEAVVERRVKEEKIKIVVEYIFENFLKDQIIPLPSTNEVRIQLGNSEVNPENIEELIDKMLWDRKVQIAINYVCENLIEVDEDQLRHDLGARHSWDDNCEYDEVMELVMERAKNLKSYYKVKA